MDNDVDNTRWYDTPDEESRKANYLPRVQPSKEEREVEEGLEPRTIEEVMANWKKRGE